MQLSEDKKRLLSNFFSLSTLQGLNMLLPLVTLPYLVQVLGAEKFGLLAFVLSIIMYFNILVSFGFELSATREISIKRDDTQKVSEIFFTVMLIKLCLTFFSLVLLTVLILIFDSFTEYRMLYYVTFGLVLGNFVFPTWFFQGMEQMKYITYINVVSKIGFTFLIFVLVKESNDFIYVPLLNSLGAILGGLYSLWLVPKILKLEWKLPSIKMLVEQLKKSAHFFLSRVANNGSRFYATTVIGTTFGNEMVGYYSMVEKLYYALMSIGGVVSQTIFPYMSRTKNIIFFKKILIVLTIGTVFILTPLFYFHEALLLFVFSINNELLSLLFIIIFSGALFGMVNVLLGYPLLAAFGYINYANNSLIYASIIYVIYISVSAFWMKDIYLVAFSTVVYAFFALIFRVYYIYKTKLFKKEGLRSYVNTKD